MNFIDSAIKVACDALLGILDKNGNPYILHSLAIGLQGKTDEEKATGFLFPALYKFEDQKVLEDYYKKLQILGCSTGILNAIKVLVNCKKPDKIEEINAIITSSNPIALQVKNYEIKHIKTQLDAFHGYTEDILRKCENLIDTAITECSKVTEYQRNKCIDSDIAIFGCGCFWGAQHHLQKETGVLRTFVGYTGGNEDSPTYEQVRSHLTHHVESVLVEYDSNLTNFEKLCQVFFEIHDPAQVDGVGPDIGPQYRSSIFYCSDQQKLIAEDVIQTLRRNGHVVNTQLLPYNKFFIGEDYHQNYYENTGGEPYCHVRVKKF